MTSSRYWTGSMAWRRHEAITLKMAAAAAAWTSEPQKEPILAADDDLAEGALAAGVVEGEAAVEEKAAELVGLVGGVAERQSSHGRHRGLG
jgi:hypothetical protein